MLKKNLQGLEGAREAVLRLLARRDHSAEELRLKLIRKGFAPADIETVLAGLTERGLLDDQGYAIKLARVLAKENHFGPRRIQQRLSAKGIHQDLIQGALDEAAREAPVRERLAASLGVKLKGRAVEAISVPEKRRLINYLRQRGFAWGDIADAVQERGGFEEE